MRSTEVKGKFFATLKEIVGKRFEFIALPEKFSVGDLIDLLVKRCGGEFEGYIYDGEKRVQNYLSYMLNGININRLYSFNTILLMGMPYPFCRRSEADEKSTISNRYICARMD